MSSILFEESTELYGPYRIARMKPEQISPAVSVMLASEPWESYGFTPQTVERFIKGCVDAGMTRALLFNDDQGSEAIREQVVGIVIIQPGFLGGRFLEILAIAEPHRGKGIGTKIVEAICRECPPNIRDLFVLAAINNSNAIEFYKKLGFVDVGELPGLILPDKTERLIWLRFRD
jgi:GNAT superfamily N-acetyltransferase